MTQQSVSAPFYLRNNINRLAPLFHEVLTHLLNKHSSLEEPFLKGIRTLAGCYLLTLVEQEKIRIEETRWRAFCNYQSFRKHPDHLEVLSHCLAEMAFMVGEQHSPFTSPWYYAAFVQAIETMVGGKMQVICSNLAEAERLKRVLLGKCG